jgi:7,8-dihydropterin-6-yl-methyl-4-(beta-D-ribofuranosyl)aminobenzene 5'-phosphate synthase
VLSHGHYDHTGGLREALRTAGRPEPVYAHPAALEPKYACGRDGAAREIGMPAPDRQALRELAQLVAAEAPTEVAGGLRLTGPVPRTTDFEDTGGAFFKDPRCAEPDELPDDQAAFVETPDGVLVILGCAHAGVVNTLRYVQALTDGRGIHTVIGGMHLLDAGPRRMDETVAALRRLTPRRLFPCHCTGRAAADRLCEELPGTCGPCPAGTVIQMGGR